MTTLIAHVEILAAWDWTSPDLPVDSWWFFTIVLVLLILFIWTIARLTAHASDDIDPAEIDRQMLSAVSELRSQGELTQEEFRSIKGRLVERLAENPASTASPLATEEPEQTNREETSDGISNDESERNGTSSEKPDNKDSKEQT